MNNDGSPTWWASLKHGGLLIAPAKLGQYFPSAVDALPRYQADRLRRDVTRLGDSRNGTLSSLLDTVLEDILGLESQYWIKAGDVDTRWSQRSVTGEVLRPRRLWQSPTGVILPLFVDTSVKRIGVASGRRTASRVVEWLRRADQKIALLTNGQQWRLIHAGSDYDAWCEWDTAFWFQEGQPSPQVDALRILLGVAALSPAGDHRAPLLIAIEASRSGQAELSAVLGENVRLAAELLIRESAASVAQAIETAGITPRDVYIAASRLMMRLVIILFAEARDLLPRDNDIYYGSYGIQGLREQLDRRAGGRAQERLRHSFSAWPRLLALFRLICDGSSHEALPIPAYSGSLFAPGDLRHVDPVRRAVVAFESVQDCPSDAAVHRILDLLTRSKIKVRQGNRSTWIDAPVDFSDLSSEYVGILYQGLLDFELRRAAASEPMIFLNLGDQPALPLARLEAMDDQALVLLVERLTKKNRPGVSGEESEEEEEEEEEEGDEEELEEGASEDEEAADANAKEQEIAPDDDMARHFRERALAWAARAVEAGNLTSRPRSHSAEALAQHSAAVQTMAERLIGRVILPDQWFLVRWGGTRKGAGTFYTRPQLGTPLVRRTLQPLCYDEIGGQLIPKKPEVILVLKVGDSAMGSGSLLVGSLRYLTDALYESLYYHGRISAHGDQALCRLADGHTTDTLLEETLPVRPDHPEFEERLKARLKRYIVERCIYGVDLDPLAVELAKLSLWIETMDPRLPFEFLDHKLKWGNALVGCWFDRFQDYPVMAWEREGGDQNHDRFVHHYREYMPTSGKLRGRTVRKGDKWTQAIKDIKNEVIKSQMRHWILSQDNPTFEFARSGHTAVGLHDEALAVFEELHAIPVHETARKAALYRDKIADNPALHQLKLAFDTWCAIWFWPGDELALAPTPENFHAPPAETVAVVRRLADKLRFFHWELEFPDVFTDGRYGFDGFVGNPPWEIQKPNSKEFFSNHDPLYRALGKQEALRAQVSSFSSSPAVEEEWISYNAGFRALSNWVKHAAFPFGDPQNAGEGFGIASSRSENSTLHASWRNRRSRRHHMGDLDHPYRHQGSADLNTYKMFLELGHLLLRQDGQLGLVVPTGIYTDKGSLGLRTLFLYNCTWRWIFSFENKDAIFDIHRSYRFTTVIVRKGGQTAAIQAAFLRRSVADWEDAEQIADDYPVDQIERFSPNTKALLELRYPSDTTTVRSLYSGASSFGDESSSGWEISYLREFDMTNDSRLFPPLARWQDLHYYPDQYGNWLKGNWCSMLSGKPDNSTVLSQNGERFISIRHVEDVALPLYQGVMVRQFDFCAATYVSGSGNRAQWALTSWENKQIRPQFLMSLGDFRTRGSLSDHARFGFRDMTNPTNSRSFIAALIPPNPAGNKLPILDVRDGIVGKLRLVALSNSYCLDFALRIRFSTSAGAGSLNPFILYELPLPAWQTDSTADFITRASASLSLASETFAPAWIDLRQEQVGITKSSNWRTLWAISRYERRRLASILDALSAYSFGIGGQGLEWILRDCDHPAQVIRSKSFARGLDPKGFWRVDKLEDPELRHTILTQVAFHDLQEKGLDAFLAQNDGEGWMIPETLRLADYGLGHDDRAKEHQPVAARLGPRFLPWQLQGTPGQSWEECERHAENLRLLLGEPGPAVDTRSVSNMDEMVAPPVENESPTDLLGNPLQTDLFGNIVEPRKKRRR